ncbi:MAG TPA: cytochrome c biogenesis protein CcsA, partial [Gemmatales bacterium]|nr:cytochrome c biogenesis protein CcsA [Gemmatales bacterium]
VWQEFMLKRVSLQPRLYLADEAQKALAQLKDAIRSGQTQAIIIELKSVLAQRAESQQSVQLEQAVKQEMSRLKIDTMSDEQLLEITRQSGQPMTRAEIRNTITNKMKVSLHEQQMARNKKAISDLESRISSIGKPYIPEDPRYSQMYMDYLEARYPELYQAAISSQPVPLESIKTVLTSYDAAGEAYRSGNAEKFAKSSQAFFDTITTVSRQYAGPEYPGETTVALELTLNRVEPFKWAWISMALAAICFVISLKTNSRLFYQVAFIPFLVSLGFQVFAYYGRISISGRPPVSNMFETVVFVASMGAVFALILEYFYRNTIIILSGSCVATLGLILADQLPYSSGFDSKIEPLQPVLRSNYWLIIHVMTIVASYAAGALAWAIGNISLVLYWFNSDRRDLLKNMANLCYSAIKVAVLLLGIGTLLGGIWAAESWGRFWGWDPKETWALIALVVYLLPLHARYIGLVKDFGMAVTSVVCFAGIVMSWYGVNFVLGAGLHSYGMGDGGPWFMFLMGSVNLLWVLIVCHRRASMELAGTPQLA